MLGCDLIGFHIEDYCLNFLDCCQRYKQKYLFIGMIHSGEQKGVLYVIGSGEYFPIFASYRF